MVIRYSFRKIRSNPPQKMVGVPQFKRLIAPCGGPKLELHSRLQGFHDLTAGLGISKKTLRKSHGKTGLGYGEPTIG